MMPFLRTLALFALLASTVPVADAAAPKKKKRPAAAAKAAPKVAEPAPVILPSEAASRVAAWVVGSGDNHGLPWVVVDKVNAALFLYNAAGERVAAEPVLVGIAFGDDASPGVGSKKLADLGPAEKTTPAGRYLAKFGLPVAGERVLWVDYATSVAMHPIPADAASKEQRRERMLSPQVDDNRITFGCINVPRAFYSTKLRPAFRKKGGYVYVLPDTKTLEEAFPRLAAAEAGGGH
jgi:hypothetical protein